MLRKTVRRILMGTAADESLAGAEAAGGFLPINANLSHGPDPYQVVTGLVLICPLVSSHA